MQRVTSWNLRRVLRENVDPTSRLMTDESNKYEFAGTDYKSHETVNHRDGEYSRGDVTTNTIEGFFSIFKRGMKGIYQHCGEKHLHRYLAELRSAIAMMRARRKR